jgi:hypothetical protein
MAAFFIGLPSLLLSGPRIPMRIGSSLELQAARRHKRTSEGRIVALDIDERLLEGKKDGISY